MTLKLITYIQFNFSPFQKFNPLTFLRSLSVEIMGRGRGVSYGGGHSSLGYLFGGGEASKPAKNDSEAPKSAQVLNSDASLKPTNGPSAEAVNRNIPAGIQGNSGNNYLRANGQNCGNFITERPSTKVHAAPGGGSSLGYLFGGSSN